MDLPKIQRNETDVAYWQMVMHEFTAAIAVNVNTAKSANGRDELEA